MERYFGEATPKLGFGLMRLPKLEDGKSIDIEQVKKMVDLFLGAGLTYFDTAYVYDGGLSEEAAKAALVDRYPRDRFTLATKLNARVAKDAEDARNQLNVSLQRTGAGYFDYYLLHAISEGNVASYNNWDLWSYGREIKAKGLIRHLGFSFHGTPALLNKLLTEHPEVEFVQLQLNYADWEAPNVQSRACYETARKHGKSVVVMEPVKGGALADPPAPVKAVFDADGKGGSYASRAIRFIASLDGILTVLSGMSNIAQMEDNISYMKAFKPMDESEKATVEEARKALNAIRSIKCTGCRYCTEGCPMQINIPSVFSAMNQKLVWNNEKRARGEFERATREGGKPADCVACGQCEGACPQHLSIIDWLKECAAYFG